MSELQSGDHVQTGKTFYLKVICHFLHSCDSLNLK